MNPILEYYNNGQLESEAWHDNIGQYHRLNGPAYREWYRNGQLKYESWRVDGKYHRLDGPARQLWHVNGQLFVEEWCVDKGQHRLNGPAYRSWYDDGQLQYEEWWLNGIKYEKEEYPLTLFCKEHNLSEVYEEWPNDMKVLFEVMYK